AVLGKKKTLKFDTKVPAYVASLEVMQNFTSFEIDELKGFTTREEIVSFKYRQTSDWPCK
ncbi:MAG: hypothetical protein IJ997_04180, partial [Mycoplasmataceae bacterium]|nr:hypothetical protein [Mycoplasmataceae bacterium]